MAAPTQPPTADSLKAQLRALEDPESAAFLMGFFKTGPGQYAEGDVFLGIRVPVVRRIAKAARGLPLAEVEALLGSHYHEERLLALVILTDRFPKAKPADREAIYDLYLGNTRSINNWDLVDASASHIVGAHLADRDRGVLDVLASSEGLWERRIGIVATHHFIRNGEFDDTLRIAEALLGDRHDLIHKAVGWMLREVGKRDLAPLIGFLEAHAPAMPRTALRYAIERLPEPERKSWLAAKEPRLRG